MRQLPKHNDIKADERPFLLLHSKADRDDFLGEILEWPKYICNVSHVLSPFEVVLMPRYEVLDKIQFKNDGVRGVYCDLDKYKPSLQPGFSVSFTVLRRFTQYP